jgi:MoaA/NifB/PqqE/SkfB family radical SAM enzyme
MSPSFQILDGTGWMRDLRRRWARTRLPLSATLELTSRCNLRCQHCYLGPQGEQHAKRNQERDTAAVLKSLDEWAEAGCLNLVITGGDPMVRKDFADVYRHACELGMVVTVFCDGILVTDRIVELFRELPPRKVEISIYGATAETYESITRVPGSHARSWEGIRRLHAGGIRVSLKTMLMTLNRHELEAMAAQAAELGCNFRFDAAVFPCLADGTKKPLDLRVSPEEAVRLDMALPGQRERWTRSVLSGRTAAPTDRLYPCGAGTTSFYADPYGGLSPCLMTRNYRYEGQGRAFNEVWAGELGEIRSLKRTRTDSSFCGELRGACTHCPAFNRLETGDEEAESDYMRTTARLRYEAVMANQTGERT